jgi:FlaG/FlaF family flagellin (archaellin)
MKRNLTVLGAILLVAGILLGTIGFASVGFNPDKLQRNVDFAEKQYFIESDKVKAIKVADVNNTIEVTRSADRNITITYYESDKDRYEIGVGTDGKLSIRYIDDRRWYEHIGINWALKDTRVTVALPADYRSDLELTTVNGTVNVEDQMAGTLRAATTNGNIRVNKVDASGEAHVSTVNGQVSLSSLKADSLEARCSNGRIQVDGVSVNTSIDMSTTNGSISGTLSGSAQDYTVSAGTVNGSSNLSNATGGAKSLSAHTTNGSIDIRFES